MLAPAQKTRSTAGQLDDARLGVLETEAIERIVQLDVDAEGIRIELVPIAGE